jgi:hypothetical protein
MNKKILSLLALIALLFACSSDEAENTDSQVKINVLVKNASNGQPLGEVNLKLLPSGQIKRTGASGTAEFSEIPQGQHFLLMDKEGYASLMQSVSVQANPKRPVEESKEYMLYPLTAEITGFLYYTDGKGNKIPAEGATVRFEILYDYFELGSFVNKTIDAIVEKDGKYTLPKLPAVPGTYIVWALEHEIGGVKYQSISLCEQYYYSGQDNACPSLSSGGTASVGGGVAYGKSVESSLEFKLLSWTRNVEEASPVVLEFSDAIDKSKTKANTVIAEVPVDVVYEGKTITITPLGKWGGDFSVYINSLESVNGKKTSTQVLITVGIPVDLGKAKVGGLAFEPVDESDYYFDFSWNAVKGATGYRIFAKASNGSGFVQIYPNRCNQSEITSNSKDIDFLEFYAPSNVNSNYCSWSSTLIYQALGLSSEYVFQNNGSVELLVQAYNSTSATTLKDAVTIIAKPVPPPPPPPSVDISGEKVANLTFDSFNPDNEFGFLFLRWDALEDATGYEIWVKANNSNNDSFRKYCETTNDGFLALIISNNSPPIECVITSSELGLNKDTFFEDDGYLEFYVIANNSGYQSQRSDILKVPPDDD